MTAYKKAQRFQIKPIFIQVKDLYNDSLFHCFRFYRCGHITYNQALTSKYQGQGVNPLTVADHSGWTPGVKELPKHLQPASYEYKWKRITRKNFLRKIPLGKAIAEFEKERANSVDQAQMLWWEERENEIVHARYQNLCAPEPVIAAAEWEARIAYRDTISNQQYELQCKSSDLEYDITMIYYQISHEEFQAWNTTNEAYNAAEWQEIKELETSTIGSCTQSTKASWAQQTAYREGKLFIAKKRNKWIGRQLRKLRFELGNGLYLAPLPVEA